MGNISGDYVVYSKNVSTELDTNLLCMIFLDFKPRKWQFDDFVENLQSYLVDNLASEIEKYVILDTNCNSTNNRSNQHIKALFLYLLAIVLRITLVNL
jgi:hypothetical protein